MNGVPFLGKSTVTRCGTRILTRSLCRLDAASLLDFPGGFIVSLRRDEKCRSMEASMCLWPTSRLVKWKLFEISPSQITAKDGVEMHFMVNWMSPDKSADNFPGHQDIITRSSPDQVSASQGCSGGCNRRFEISSSAYLEDIGWLLPGSARDFDWLEICRFLCGCIGGFQRVLSMGLSSVSTSRGLSRSLNLDHLASCLLKFSPVICFFVSNILLDLVLLDGVEQRSRGFLSLHL
ncbi:hypothetical protein Nepgr_013822 [Nepenthes gracilis]|uniref:Uncharacterized protein n=1 Tax=Nepenthes gracilis TaxID=150966 RepID=A0AAD3SKF1_NEPGR|nr:hypothetical protein Nepgr_013822 [Nepenthes gracilis]